jgi:tetratricopeptide (TPR) repeat protein
MVKSLVWSLALLGCLGLAGCGGPRKSSNVAQVHYILGISYLQEQNVTLALKEFLLAEEVDPDDADIQASLGQAYQLKKAFDPAEKHYLRALKLRPDDPRLQNNLGSLYLDMKRWDEAGRYFQAAAGNLLFTNPEVALTGLGFAHYNQARYHEAIAAYKQALAQDARYVPAHYRLGEVYYAMDKLDFAIAAYLQALALAPNEAPIHYQLGLCYMKKNDKAKAVEAFAESIRLAPGAETARLAADYLKLLQ